MSPYDDRRRPLVISHRTNMGDAPENTLAGIETALRDGCDAVEVDVRATRDGVPVLMHDETLKRVTGDPRPVAGVTLAELRTLRMLDPHGGEPQPVPTLTEALALLDGRCAIEIDLPMRGLEAAILQVVRAAEAETWTWFTTHPPQDTIFLRAASPQAQVYLSVAAQPRWVSGIDEAIAIAVEQSLTGINPALEAIDEQDVIRAHERGLRVGTWTVNRPADIERALDLGVDAITTDHPQRVFEAMAARGLRGRDDAWEAGR